MNKRLIKGNYEGLSLVLPFIGSVFIQNYNETTCYNSVVVNPYYEIDSLKYSTHLLDLAYHKTYYCPLQRLFKRSDKGDTSNLCFFTI